MDASRRRERIRLSRRLRLVLAALLLLWFFAPGDIRSAVPVWLAFAVALALEIHFLVVNYGRREPFFEGGDRGPQAIDRERFGGADGDADWAIVETEHGRAWVDLAAEELPEGERPDEAETDERPSAATPHAARRRWRLVRPLAEALAVLAVVAGILVWLDRSGWDDLASSTQGAVQERISAEAARIVGRPVVVGCDTSGEYVGVVRHADGIAEVGGDRAYLTPDLCYALYELTEKGDVRSYDETARAIAVLAHESWHLRGERDEAVTECYALQSGVELGMRLGLDEDAARRMMRSRLVQNSLRRGAGAEYVLPRGCENRGRYDLKPDVDLFP